MGKWAEIIREPPLLTPFRRARRYARNWITYLARGLAPAGGAPVRAVVFVDFRQGLDRYGYLLLKSLHLSGYRIVLRHNYQFFADPRRYAELTFGIPGLRITFTLPAETRDLVYLSDAAPAEAYLAPPWRKAVLLNIDVFSDGGRMPDALHVPYLMHPRMYEDGLYKQARGLRSTARTMRVFFAGNTDPAVYGDKEFVPFLGVPRHELIEHARRELSSAELMDVDDAADLPAAREGGARLFILRRKVPKPAWLPTLARSDFFLAAPGVVMPLCHNLVEALSVGTIPIIEHPGCVSPPLQPGRNCIAFHGKADLIAKLRQALSMSDNEISRMRDEAIRYSEKHLLPDSVVHRIEAAEEAVLNMFMVAGWDSIAAYRKKIESGV